MKTTYTSPSRTTDNHRWKPPMFPEPQAFTEAEVRALRKARDDYAAELSEAQDQIRRCREQLKELERREIRLADLLWTCSRALAPVTRVPNDILREIFLRCLPNRWEIEFDPHEAPVLLTRVCRRWKDLAMGFASLWSALKVKPYSMAESRDFGLQLSGEWLGRAQQTSIGLQLVAPPLKYEFGSTLSEILPRLIQPNISPFITVLSLVHVPLQDIVAVSPGVLTALQRLSLLVQVNSKSLDPCPCHSRGPIRAFENCPNLTSVALQSDFCGSQTHDHIVLPLPQLLHFIQGGRPYYPSITTQLPALPRLRLLSLRLLRKDVWFPDDPSPSQRNARLGTVAVKNLKTLRIEMPHYPGIFSYPDLFSRYEFPNLERLMIESMERPLEFAMGSAVEEQLFHDKLSAFQSLTSLSIKGYAVGLSELQKILQSTPRVTTLHLELTMKRGNCNPSLLLLTLDHQWTAQAPSGHLIPFLHTFSIHIEQMYRGEEDEEMEPMDAQVLENFIESRLASEGREDVSHQTGRNLRKIVIVVDYEDDLDTQSEFVRVLNDFIPKGLEVELKVKKENEWTMMVPEVSGWVEAADVH